MLPLAALLSGFGGLLLQLAWLRRHGLLLGHTSTATAQVLGLFLAGIGVGGLLGARWLAMRPNPLRHAVQAYLVVALFAVLAEPVLRTFPSLSPGVAQAALVVVPGLPAVAMGVGFPLLFAGLGRGAGAAATGVLAAANLLGAVGGALLGGNLLVPEVGLLRCGQIGAACYVGAAALLAVRVRRTADLALPVPLPPPAAPRLRLADSGLAFGTGLLLLGSEIVWLRRLPFFLEGFQPTLAGVVAVVLFWSALGAALLTPVLHRVLGPRAPAGAALLALLGASLGMHEWAAPAVMHLPVDSTLGMHARILAGASLAAALPCMFLGAVVPLLLVPFVHPQTRGVPAGVLFGALGLGELAGALLAGHVLPWLLPRAYFGAAPMAVGLAAALAWSGALGRFVTFLVLSVVAAAGLLGASGAGGVLEPRLPAQGSRYDRPLDYRHLAHAVDATLCASVAYNRRTHSMVLFTDEFRATETGPNTTYMRVLGHLPFLLRTGIERAAVIALGTGTTLDAVAAWPDCRRIDVVELSAAVVAMAGAFTADGPVSDGRPPLFATDPRAHLHVTDGRAFLARCAPGTLDLVTMEPLLPYAPGTAALYSSEFYALAQRALAPRGLLLQWLPTHAMPRAMFDSLLATLCRSFPHVSVWLVDHSTIVVASPSPHLPEAAALAARYTELPPGLTATLHEAGLASPSDVWAALVAADVPETAATGRVLRDDTPFLERLAYWSGEERLAFLPDNLLRLAELAALDERGAAGWRDVRLRRLSGLRNLAQSSLPDPGAAALPRAVLDFDAARIRAPHSVLLHREQGRALRAVYETQIVRGASLPQALRSAERLVQLDARSALALAVLAAAATDPAVRDRRAAEALALDPLLWAAVPPLLADLRLRSDFVSPREDLGRLPEGAALAAAASGEGARAVALRGTFPARVGQALNAAAAAQPLAAEARGALLPLLDPWLFERLAAAVAARDGDLVAEVLPLWRRDLPAVDPLARLLVAPVAARLALAAALAGRAGREACELLARLLEDQELEVRRQAALALARTAGDRIPYDPEGPESARSAAAAALRALHNPPP